MLSFLCQLELQITNNHDTDTQRFLRKGLVTALDKAARYILQTFSFQRFLPLGVGGRQGIMELRLAWNSGRGRGRALLLQALGLQTCGTTAGLQGARAGSEGFIHARQALCANSATFLALQIHLEFLTM